METDRRGGHGSPVLGVDGGDAQVDVLLVEVLVECEL